MADEKTAFLIIGKDDVADVETFCEMLDRSGAFEIAVELLDDDSTKVWFTGSVGDIDLVVGALASGRRTVLLQRNNGETH